MSFEPVCKFYSYNRNCKFGESCRYLHSSEISERPPPTSEESRDGAVKQRSQHLQFQPRVQFVETSDKTNHEDSLKPSHRREQSAGCAKPLIRPYDDGAPGGVINKSATSRDDSYNTTRPRNICRYFKDHGYCAFGRNCRFIHDNSDVKLSATANKPRHQTQNVRKEIPPRFQRKDVTSPKSSLEEDLKDSSKDHSSSTECDPHVEQDDAASESRAAAVEDQTARGSHNASTGSGKVCRYFKAGYCSRGRRCMFLHDRRSNKGGKDTKTKERGQTETVDKEAEQDENVKPQTKYQRPVSVRPAGVLPQVVKLSDLQSNGTEKYRQFDVNYLEKRFQGVRCGADDTKTESTELLMEVMFSPSDPDWPFDVRTFTLDLALPENYPEKAMSVAVSSDKQDLPDTVRRYLEICMNEWISDRQEELAKNNKAELMVRPFFRWLDRNFEDVMTEALKQLKRELTARAAGFEFIPATTLKAKYTVEDNDGDGSASQEEACDSLTGDEDDSSDDLLETDESSDESQGSDEEENEERQPALNLDTDRSGTEIQLRHLQLKNSASSLLFERLHLLIQCARCKHHSEVTLGADRAVALTCEKCSQEIFVQYRPTLAHQFSSVIGYLDLDNGLAFDLIFPDCKIVVSCLACGKITKINGMMSGQMVDGWCQACNARFKFAVESVKFYQLQPSSLDEEKKKKAVVSKPKNSKKPPKDPAIKEGQPLPDFGTCRHYKQSYRWLRFPCCGKAYPCDVCHDKKEDHEMTLANRMICGHCCKEQNYSASRPCTSCGHHMTKIRSAHWEGGSGCRDRIAMSRNDQQKYKNMNKTISRKKGSSGSGNKPKNTKLRHA